MKCFAKEDTVMLLIDQEAGTLEWCANRLKQMIISRAKALALLAKVPGIPVVLPTDRASSAVLSVASSNREIRLV